VAILTRHNYPAPVARLLGEAVVLASLIGSSLKFEGRFIMQTQTDGPVNLIVVDLDAPDGLRGYARFDADAVRIRSQQVGPFAGPVVRVFGPLQQPIDQLNALVRVGVTHEFSNFLGSRNAADQVQVSAAQEARVVGRDADRDLFAALLGADHHALHRAFFRGCDLAGERGVLRECWC